MNLLLKKHARNTGMLLLPFCFLASQPILAQENLVPNPSFEQYTHCPSGTRNDKPDIWYKPDKRGAGYKNACADDTISGVPFHYTAGGTGFQYARTGVAYIGMFYLNSPSTNSRNYFQIKLLDSLKKGGCYYVECFVNRQNPFRIACNNQSILFTNSAVYVDTISPLGIQILPANPQITNYSNPIISDTLNWIKVSGVFMAQGGEQYLTLGNFSYDNQTNYTLVNPGGGYPGAAYYIDDVSVYVLDSFPLKADAGRDTTIALGDNVFIGSYTNGLTNVKWYNAAGQVIDSVRPGFYVQPTGSTFYVLEQTVCGHYSRDTVSINIKALPLHWLNFTCTAINNNAASLKWQTANEVNVSHFIIQRSRNGRNFENIAARPANNTPYNEYHYIDEPPGRGRWYYRLIDVDKDGSKTYSIVRSLTFNDNYSAIAIYPNPAKKMVNLRYENIALVVVYDMTGRIVLSDEYGNTNNVRINVSGLSAGLYIIKVRGADGNIHSRKLVIK